MSLACQSHNPIVPNSPTHSIYLIATAPVATHATAPQIPRYHRNDDNDINSILRAQVLALDQTHNTDEKWTNWLYSMNLYAFSATLGNGVGVVSYIRRTLRDLPSDVHDYRIPHHFRRSRRPPTCDSMPVRDGRLVMLKKVLHRDARSFSSKEHSRLSRPSPTPAAHSLVPSSLSASCASTCCHCHR